MKRLIVTAYLGLGVGVAIFIASPALAKVKINDGEALNAQELPSESKYTPVVKQLVTEGLHDPYSAVVGELLPRKITCSAGAVGLKKILLKKERWRGWAVYTQRNAKNLYGAYVGNEPQLVMVVGLRDGTTHYELYDPVSFLIGRCYPEEWSADVPVMVQK